MNYTWKLDRIKRKTTSDVTNAVSSRLTGRRRGLMITE